MQPLNFVLEGAQFPLLRGTSMRICKFVLDIPKWHHSTQGIKAIAVGAVGVSQRLFLFTLIPIDLFLLNTKKKKLSVNLYSTVFTTF